MSRDAREQVLASIRKATTTADGEAARRAAVQARIAAHKPGVIPARASGSGAEALVALVARLKAAAVTVAESAHPEDIPRLAADYLRTNNLPAKLRMGSDPLLAGLPWGSALQLDVAVGRAEPNDSCSIAHAFAGIAESGTLVMTSGPENPTTLNFLPEAEIIVLRAADVVGGYEDAWQRLRTAFGDKMPRTVNWISGPSRTADIEQTIVMGAHGPRKLHVIVTS